jgi:hypothetical protein
VLPEKVQEALEGDATRAGAAHVGGIEALRLAPVHHGDESLLAAREGLAHGQRRGRAAAIVTSGEPRCGQDDRGREQEALLRG